MTGETGTSFLNLKNISILSMFFEGQIAGAVTAAAGGKLLVVLISGSILY
jgi:hypothetical protein